MALGRMMTVAEIAEALHCSRETVYHLLRAGQIPGAFRFGNRWRVNSDQFHVWMRRTEGTNKSSRTRSKKRGRGHVGDSKKGRR